MKKKIIVLVALVLLAACGSKKEEEWPTTSQLRMVQATSQIALKRNGLEDDTSPSLDDWTINFQEKEGSLMWTSVVQSKANGRVKVIFEWTGEDKDDLILKYLLAGGNELVNDL